MSNVLTAILLILRWVHFLGGVVWIGTIIYLGTVHFPAVRRNGTLAVSQESVQKMNNLLVVASILSAVTGVSIALMISGLNTDVFTATSWGISIFVGALFTLVALVTTFAKVLPALERLSSGTPGKIEDRRTIREAQIWINVTMALGVLVLLMMASAGSL